jgi:DNA-binding SARP family transcriptional activator/tetratricopeptide (TPR) repeat protein
MRWRLLGPMELIGDEDQHCAPVALGPGKQRCLLASLLLTPGQVVPAGTLVDRIWGDAPPRSATPLAPYATRLRRVLDPVVGPGSLRYTAGGYLIDCDPDSVDLHRARRRVIEARAAEEAGDDERATALLLAALRDWGDEALAGVPGAWAGRVRDDLARERLDVLARYGRCALRLGRAEEVADRLGSAAAEHPTVESLVTVLMSALVAAGRPAQALETFARTRDAIVERLGSEPGPELAGLHTSILRGDAGPSAAVRPRPGVPAQLPADALAFTGRRAELAELDRALTGPSAGGVRVAVVSGPPGAGKSALAVHWGHRTTHRFPDGQLYLNLRGFQSRDPDSHDDVMSPEEAARNLLVALAPGHPVPAGLDARTGLLRSLLAGRRLLLVLDNARDAAHVRPLLPGTGDCAVVVTSRDRLTGLVASHGALPVRLDALDPGQAGELLAARLGAARLAAEPCIVATLAAATAGLPLALVTVAARAAMRTGQPLAELAAELAATRLDGARLAGLSGDGGTDEGAEGRAGRRADAATDPRTVFSWSYQALAPDAARLFRLFGAGFGPDLSAAAAVSLAGVSAAGTAAALAELLAASLISEHRPGRFVMHDLLRAYAEDLLPEAERDPAARRMLDHLLHTGHAAALEVDPQREPLTLAAPAPGVETEPIRGETAALEWFAAEHPALMAAVRHGEHLGDYGWQLPWVVIDFLDRQGHWDDWITVETIAVAAAHRRGETRAEASAHRVLARGYVQVGRYEEAEPHYAEAERLYERTGDLLGQAHTLFSISWMRDQQGRDEDCLLLTGQALELYRKAGNRVGEARALSALGWTLGRQGRHDLTLRHCEEALELHQELGDRYGEAASWDSVGWAHHHLGDHERAVDAYGRALDLYRAAGDLLNEAEIREHLGDAHAAAGAPAAAALQWRQALALLEKLGHPGAATLRVKLRSPVRPGSG